MKMILITLALTAWAVALYLLGFHWGRSIVETTGCTKDLKPEAGEVIKFKKQP